MANFSYRAERNEMKLNQRYILLFPEKTFLYSYFFIYSIKLNYCWFKQILFY